MTLLWSTFGGLDIGFASLGCGLDISLASALYIGLNR